MCLSMKTPSPPPLPAPPPEPPKIVDAEIVRARDEQIRKMRQAAGAASTMLTKPGQIASVARQTKKTALGV